MVYLINNLERNKLPLPPKVDGDGGINGDIQSNL